LRHGQDMSNRTFEVRLKVKSLVFRGFFILVKSGSIYVNSRPKWSCVTCRYHQIHFHQL